MLYYNICLIKNTLEEKKRMKDGKKKENIVQKREKALKIYIKKIREEDI